VSEEDARTVDERPGARTSGPAAAEAPREDAATLAGRYRRGAEIARGGMGRVVEAEDALLGRTVALKETLELDEDARMRFEREVRITARLEHPSIVPVYDAGHTADGLPFYVMRRLSGRPLDQVVRAAADLDGRLTLLPNLLAVLDAVAHAHRRGVIHRDLKPGNVLVGDLGETIVIDWGLAKVLGEAEAAITTPVVVLGSRTGTSDATVAGAVVGTPGFMAPEQAIADAVDARADVYALGATLYYLLAGTAPHAGSSTTEILDRTVAGPPRPLPEVVPGVPPDLVTIVDKAMAADPAARYADAAAMGEDLRRFLAGQLVAAHHYSGRERLARFVRRYRAVIAAIALALAAIAVIATLSLRRIVADRDRIAGARADAEARARDLRRHNDKLILEQAASYLRVDPTLAVATLRRLPADSDQWASAHSIAAEASVRGISFALQGHTGAIFDLEISPDGTRVVSHGGDHRALVHDLTTRTSKLLDTSDVPARRSYRWTGDRIARLASDAHTLDLLDPAAGAPPERLSERAIALDTSVDGTLAWLEDDGALRIRAPGGAVEVAGRFPGAGYVTLGPGGTVALIGGLTDLTAVLGRGPGGWRVVVRPRPGTFAGAVSFDGTALALIEGSTLVEYDLAASPPVPQRRVPGETVMVTYAGNTLYSIARENGKLRWYSHAPSTSPRAVSESANLHGGKVAVVGDGVLALPTTSPTTRVVLTFQGRPIGLPGLDPIRRVAARANTPYVVGAAPGRLQVWDLREMSPRFIDIQIQPAAATNLGAHHVLFAGGVIGHLLDVRDNTYRVRELLGLPDGASINREVGVMTIAAADHVAVVAADPWSERTIPTPSPFRHAAARDAETVIAATADGAIVELVGRDATRRALASLGEPAAGITARGRWVLIVGARRMWRSDGTTTETADAGVTIETADIAPDGTVHALATGGLVRWPVGGSPGAVAPMPVPLHDVATPRADRVFAASVDGAVWRLDPTAGPGQVVPPLTSLANLGRDGECAIGVRQGEVIVADIPSRTRWTFGDGHATLAVSGRSCDEIFVMTSVKGLELWQIQPPRNPTELQRWLAARTNARAADSGGVIEWAFPPL
jgi:hypothetical protein